MPPKRTKITRKHIVGAIDEFYRTAASKIRTGYFGRPLVDKPKGKYLPSPQTQDDLNKFNFEKYGKLKPHEDRSCGFSLSDYTEEKRNFAIYLGTLSGWQEAQRQIFDWLAIQQKKPFVPAQDEKAQIKAYKKLRRLKKTLYQKLGGKVSKYENSTDRVVEWGELYEHVNHVFTQKAKKGKPRPDYLVQQGAKQKALSLIKHTMWF